jgi:hypothetical protein
VKRIDSYEASKLPKGASAYLLVTNIGFHRNLDGTPTPAMLPFGLGILDFNRPGYMRLSEIYRQKQKYIDAHHIGESFLNYTKFPTTFDGSLPSDAFGAASSRVKIGESYLTTCGPDDPTVCVLRVTPLTAELWDGPARKAAGPVPSENLIR